MATTSVAPMNADAGLSALLGWCNGLRARVAPVDALNNLHDHVQYFGNNYIEEQLDKILSAPHSDITLVEFAKTPSRRKDPLRTGRTPLHSALRLKAGMDSNKENAMASPRLQYNAFTQKLMQARDEVDETFSMRGPLQTVHENSPQRPDSVDDLFSPGSNQLATTALAKDAREKSPTRSAQARKLDSDEGGVPRTDKAAAVTKPLSSESGSRETSLIDATKRAQTPVERPASAQAQLQPSATRSAAAALTQPVAKRTVVLSKPAPFLDQSVGQGSKLDWPVLTPAPARPPSAPPIASKPTASNAPSSVPSTTPGPALRPATAPTPSAIDPEDNTTRYFNASQSSAGSDNTTRMFPRDEKGRPILQMPSPIKKRDPSLVQTAGTGPNSRTSWMVRARTTQMAKKRKSEERDDEPAEERTEHKKPKIETVYETPGPSQSPAVPLQVGEESSGPRRTSSFMMLGGKSVSGSVAAAAAIAKAKARLADRKGEDDTKTSLPGDAVPPPPTTTPALVQESSSTSTSRRSLEEDKERRLSISDLVTRLEEKAKEQDSRNSKSLADASMSTTPPDSPPRSLSNPPQTQQQRILVPRPVLEPPPVQQQQQQPKAIEKPVLVPRFAPKAPPPASVPAPAPSTSTLPNAALAPLPARFFLPLSPSHSLLRKQSPFPSAPVPVTLSAQSTMVSVTDSVFSSEQTQETQDTEWMGSQADTGKPFDARMVPDETRFWDKTPHRVPGTWADPAAVQGGAMDIDEDEDDEDDGRVEMGSPAAKDTAMQWSDGEEDQLDDELDASGEEEEEVLAPPRAPVASEVPVKKAGLLSSIYRAFGGGIVAQPSSSSAAMPAPVSILTPARATPTPEPTTMLKQSFVPKRNESREDAPNKKPRLDRAGSEQPQTLSSSQMPNLLKSQFAAQAAKKAELEKQNKQKAVKESMEARRLAAAQRKKEEEEARTAELERKQREDLEKRKREREAEEKRLPRPAPAHKKAPPSDDESNKKRKPEPVVVKKVLAAPQTIKKPAPDSRPPSRIGKGNLASSSAVPQAGSSALGKSGLPSRAPAAGPAASVKLVAQPPPEVALPMPPPFTPVAALVASSQSSSAMPPPPPPTMIPTKNKFGGSHATGPAKSLQEQMQARVQAQIDAANGEPNPDDIELPEIKSDSESDDNDSFDTPDWAQSPNLKRLLREQMETDPDEIFGAIRDINLEDIFSNDKSKHAKFRARSSSANWNGRDGLTFEEREAYAVRMGYKRTDVASQQ